MERRSSWNASLVLGGLSVRSTTRLLVYFGLLKRKGVDLGLGSARLTRVLDLFENAFQRLKQEKHAAHDKT